MLEGKDIPYYTDQNGAEVKAVQIKKFSQRAEDGLFMIEPYGSVTGPVFVEPTGILEKQPEKGDWCLQLDDGKIIFISDEEFKRDYKEE